MSPGPRSSVSRASDRPRAHGASGPPPLSQLSRVRAVLDERALCILRSTASQPLTAVALSRLCGTTLPTCRRLLEKLEGLGLLVSEPASVQLPGRPARAYRSALRTFHVRMEAERIWTRIEVSSGSARLVTEWETNLVGSGAHSVPQVFLQRRAGERPAVVHRIEAPPDTGRGKRAGPIVLPSFLRQSPREPT